MRAPMSSDNVQALPPGTRLGDYRFDAVIGQGGFGITYRAFDTQLAKFVAIFRGRRTSLRTKGHSLSCKPSMASGSEVRSLKVLRGGSELPPPHERRTLSVDRQAPDGQQRLGA